MTITISAQWEEMAAQLDELAQVPADAAALVESLAAAVFPPGTVIPQAARELLRKLAAALGHELG